MKYKSLYDTESIIKCIDSVNESYNTSLNRFNDAKGGLLNPQNLVAVNPTVYKMQYPDLSLIESGININNFGAYLPVVQSVSLEPIGSWEVADNRSSNDGKITLSADYSNIKSEPFKAFATWTDIEQNRISQAANINLPTEELNAMSYLYLVTVDEVGLVGKTSIDKLGLLNNKSFHRVNLDKKLTELEPMQAYYKLLALINEHNTRTQNTQQYLADTIILPVEVYNYINNYQMLIFVNGTNLTVYEALQARFKNMKIVPSPRATNVSIDGANTNVIAIFNRHENNLTMRIPVPMKLTPVQQDGWKYKVDGYALIAGIDILRKESGTLVTGA